MGSWQDKDGMESINDLQISEAYSEAIGHSPITMVEADFGGRREAWEDQLPVLVFTNMYREDKQSVPGCLECRLRLNGQTSPEVMAGTPG